MYVIGAYVIVAILIVIVVWAIRRRKKKCGKGSDKDWSLKKQFAELEDMQKRVLRGEAV